MLKIDYLKLLLLFLIMHHFIEHLNKDYKCVKRNLNPKKSIQKNTVDKGKTSNQKNKRCRG